MYWHRYLVSCMAGATWKLHGWCHVNCCRLGANSVYTIQPCSRLQRHFIQSHILGACAFRCNLPPALLTEWSGSFTCYCGNTRVERIPKILLESAQKVDPGEEISHHSCGNSNPGTFRSRVRRSNHWAIPALDKAFDPDVTCEFFLWRNIHNNIE